MKKREATTLVFDAKSGLYCPKDSQELAVLQSQNRSVLPHQKTEAIKPKSGTFEVIVCATPVIAAALMLNPLPLFLYALPLIVSIGSDNVGDKRQGNTIQTKGRRRKGRTDLPLYDVELDCLSTRMNR